MQNRFSISIPYNEKLLPQLGQIMGKEFCRSTKMFSFPGSEIIKLANTLEKYYPSISFNLRNNDRYKNYRDMVKDDEITVKLSKSSKSRFEPPKPSNMEFRPFQKAGVFFGIRGNRDNLLNSDDMGLGKTCETIGIMNYLNIKKALIVTTNSSKFGWLDEFKNWSTITDRIHVVSTSISDYENEREIKNSDYIIINYEALKKWKDLLFTVKRQFVACDEAHKLKNPKAQRSQISLALCDACDYRTLITGSPIVNRPQELWNLLQILDPSYWRNWWDYVTTYCGAQKDRWTGLLTYSTPRNSIKLQYDLRKTVMLRRQKHEVLKDLPPKTRQLIELEKSSSYSDILKTQDKYMKTVMKFMETNSMDVTEKLSSMEDAEKRFRDSVRSLGDYSLSEFNELSKIRHKIGLAKVPAVIEFCNEILEQKQKIGIFCHHQDVAQKYINEFKKECAYIIGGMKDTERHLEKKKFQENDKYRVFVGTIYAAGESITLTKSDICIFAEVDWVPGMMCQCEDRFHRIGTINPVNCFYLVLPQSIDYYIASTIISKLDLIDRITNSKFLRKLR